MADPAIADDGADLLRRLDSLRGAFKQYRTVLVIGLIAILLGFALLSVRLWQLREQEIRNARAWQQRAELVEKTLARTREAASKDDWEQVRGLLYIARSESQALADSAREATVSGSAEPSPVPLPTPTATPARSWPQTVYIQFAGSITREQIVALNASLKSGGWPGTQSNSGERIGVARGLNEVRYRDPADKPAADALAAAVTAAGIGSRPVEARQLAIIRPGTLEVWISN